jgi:hypothetical protein
MCVFYLFEVQINEPQFRLFPLQARVAPQRRDAAAATPGSLRRRHSHGFVGLVRSDSPQLGPLHPKVIITNAI